MCGSGDRVTASPCPWRLAPGTGLQQVPAQGQPQARGPAGEAQGCRAGAYVPREPGRRPIPCRGESDGGLRIKQKVRNGPSQRVGESTAARGPQSHELMPTPWACLGTALQPHSLFRGRRKSRIAPGKYHRWREE